MVAVQAVTRWTLVQDVPRRSALTWLLGASQYFGETLMRYSHREP